LLLEQEVAEAAEEAKILFCIMVGEKTLKPVQLQDMGLDALQKTTCLATNWRNFLSSAA
jgi:hypothetical protein